MGETEEHGLAAGGGEGDTPPKSHPRAPTPISVTVPMPMCLCDSARMHSGYLHRPHEKRAPISEVGPHLRSQMTHLRLQEASYGLRLWPPAPLQKFIRLSFHLTSLRTASRSRDLRERRGSVRDSPEPIRPWTLDRRRLPGPGTWTPDQPRPPRPDGGPPPRPPRPPPPLLLCGSLDTLPAWVHSLVRALHRHAGRRLDNSTKC